MTGAAWWKPFLLVLVATSPAGVCPAVGWQLPDGPTQKLRVAVMDLSGSALKMQSTTSMMPGGQPSMQQPYGQPATRQTTVTVEIPPPAEFARGLTEALTTVLVRTGRFTVLERAAIQSVQQEQQIGASGAVTRETAARTGALLGAEVLITGDITGFTYSRSGIGGGSPQDLLITPQGSYLFTGVRASLVIDVK